MKNSLILLYLCIIGVYAKAQCTSDRYQKSVFTQIDTWNDVSYCNNANNYLNVPYGNLKIDIRAPKNDYLSKRPLFIFAFGGGFMVGAKTDTDVAAWCDSLAHYGYVTVALQYRLGMNVGASSSAIRAVYRAVQDMNAAIRFLKQNQLAYGIDTSHIFLAGESAGAITALHTAFLNQNTDRPQETFYQNFTAPDLGDLDATGSAQSHPFLYQHIKGIISLWGAMYKLNYINTNEKIPVCFIHGTDDNIVYYDVGAPFVGDLPSTFPVMYGSYPTHNYMDSLGNSNDLHPFLGENHVFYGVPNLTFPTQLWDTVFTMGHQFLYKQLQFESPLPIGNLTPITSTTETYNVPSQLGSQYCWEVQGGTLISQNGNQCTIAWGLAGNGSVSVTEKNALDIVGTKKTLAVSIQQIIAVQPSLSFIQSLQVYPNPAVNEKLFLSLQASQAQDIYVRIQDGNGKVLSTEKWAVVVGENKKSIAIASLSKGMYYCMLVNQNKENQSVTFWIK